MSRIAIIGAGAAGCFCAVELKRRFPEAEVCVYEAAKLPMLKLARTGGGRCNLSNTFAQVNSLQEFYPRGHRLMKRALMHFSPEQSCQWWENAGVRLMVQDDERIFPASEDAMQIVRTLERLMRQCGVELKLGQRPVKISQKNELNLQPQYVLSFADGSNTIADKVVLTLGGCSTGKLAAILPEGISLATSVPSLFSFKIANPDLRALAGTSIEKATISLAGSKLKSSGALLISDWGLSGPAVLRLSSWEARELAKKAYQAALLVCWTGDSEQEIRSWINANSGSQRQLSSIRPEGISERLWRYLLGRAGLKAELRWKELGSKGANRLVATLSADEYAICGRASFKEEFVTCGGVELAEVKTNNLESRNYPGLYFAGEVLDIDAVTGGFNLQAAWSTAKLVADGMEL